MYEKLLPELDVRVAKEVFGYQDASIVRDNGEEKCWIKNNFSYFDTGRPFELSSNPHTKEKVLSEIPSYSIKKTGGIYEIKIGTYHSEGETLGESLLNILLEMKIKIHVDGKKEIQKEKDAKVDSDIAKYIYEYTILKNISDSKHCVIYHPKHGTRNFSPTTFAAEYMDVVERYETYIVEKETKNEGEQYTVTLNNKFKGEAETIGKAISYAALESVRLKMLVQ